MDTRLPSPCAGCGAPIQVGTGGGLCPVCLLGGGLGGGAGEEQLDEFVPAAHIGSSIGRYRLVEEIGEGGFGVVYLAEQTEPVKRRVALKVIKPGMDSKEVIARFEAERQALALMDHPNIALVHDAGATSNGRPYFVMELVRGIPITSYCDRESLSTKQRLELFIDVCSAVQHAHQKGIIHRDLKPSNILVSAQHGAPVVKVIDFGIAKAINMELTEKTVFTELGRMIGTPQYMSPEQAHLNAVDVDTRSDIHSLGVVLYELLTGKTPLDIERLRVAGYAEMQQMIRQDLPVKPSACVTSLGASLPAIAEKRATEPGRLRRMLRGDLDWIVMKALEKDRARRYQTTNGLAVDIRRFLDNEPVSASPPSAGYRCVQFAKRHRAGVTWTAVIGTVVLAAVVAISVLGLHAIQAGEKERESAWKSNLSDADALRSSDRPERRWMALEKLEQAIDIPPGLDGVDVAGSPGGSEAKKRLRDAVISLLAIADMRNYWQWEIDVPEGSDTLVTADRGLTRYAYSLPDGRIAIRPFPESGGAPEDEAPVILSGRAGEMVSRVLEFSPDGNTLAAGYQSDPDSDWKLTLWKLDRDGSPKLEVDGGSSQNAFAFYPDGQLCALGRDGDGGSIDIIDCESGELIRTLPSPGVPRALSVSSSGVGEYLAVSLPERVVVVRSADGEIVSSLNCKSPGALAWGPVDGSLAVCTKKFLAVWRGQDWIRGDSAEFLELRSPVGVVDDALAWSPDGRLLASQSSRDGTCRLWDPFQGGMARCWHRGVGSSLQFSGDGSKLGVLREGTTLKVFEVVSGDVCFRARGHTGDIGIYDGVWNREGTLLATTGDDGVRLWNRDGRHLGHIKVERPRGVAFSGESLFVAALDGLFRWRMAPATLPGTVAFQPREKVVGLRSCEQASLSPDGNFLAVAARPAGAGEPSALWLVDLVGGGPPQQLLASEGAKSCVISGDGLWLAAGSTSGEKVSIWAMPTAGSAVGDLSPVESLDVSGFATVAFSPLDPFRPRDPSRRAQWLVTGDSRYYKFWNTGTWELEADKSIPSKMGARSGKMTFSSRGTALGIAVNGIDMKVYSLPTSGSSSSPEELSSPDFDREIPLCFSPYGRIMVTAKPTGLIFFWQLDDLRERLREMGIDWELRDFPAQEFEIVSRIILPQPGEVVGQSQ